MFRTAHKINGKFSLARAINRQLLKTLEWRKTFCYHN